MIVLLRICYLSVRPYYLEGTILILIFLIFTRVETHAYLERHRRHVWNDERVRDVDQVEGHVGDGDGVAFAIPSWHSRGHHV